VPVFDSNDPSEFGWTLGPRWVVPFSYGGHSFPSGLDSRLVGVFTLALDRLCAVPGFALHSGLGLGDGMWGYEDRNVTGGTSKSFHAFAAALDVNAPWNQYGARIPAPSPWRLPLNTSEIVEPLGLLWGGGSRWGSHRDWMHIENHNTPAEAAGYSAGGRRPPAPAPGAGAPFPLPSGSYYGPLSGPASSISGAGRSDGPYRPGLRIAQGHLHVTADGLYGPITALATTKFQAAHGLVADGLIGPRTWAALVNPPTA